MKIVLLFLLTFAASALCSRPWPSSSPAPSGLVDIDRFDGNPLVSFSSVQLPCDGDYDINFPTVIRVPDFVRDPLGKYYMYFSDHHGLFVYLAYANKVAGPWTVYAPPTATLAQAYAANNLTYVVGNISSSSELAAADIYVDKDNELIRMYVHRRLPNDGYTNLETVAFSRDGINFSIMPGSIGLPYMRHFVWEGDNYIYLIDRLGNLLRSRDGYTNLVMGNRAIGESFQNASMFNGDGYTGYPRHFGVSVAGNTLHIFGSRIGDAPETIVWTSMDLRCTLSNWTACKPAQPAQVAFYPARDYEGIDYPNVPSKKGSAINVRQLRDPFPFYDNGKCYLFYTIAGESGIAGGQIPKSYCKGKKTRSDGDLSEASADAESVAIALASWLSPRN